MLRRSGNSEAADTSNSGKPDPETYEAWLARLFPGYVAVPFADFHDAYWTWVWALEAGKPQDAFIAIWPREAGKSTNAELGCAAVAARGTRRYALYVCETQDQADQHVQNVASLFESSAFGSGYATVSSRMVGKFGNQKGWRANRLRTASGFTIDAVGLDKSVRGLKVEEIRPDLIVLDDIDSLKDNTESTRAKIATLTKTVLPTLNGASGAVLAVQNLIIPDGVFAQLADGRADFLSDRVVSGPHVAVKGLRYEKAEVGHVITGGAPTWNTLEFWQGKLRKMGLTAFLAECQHEVEDQRPGTLVYPSFSEAANVTEAHPVSWKDCLYRIVGIDPGGGDPCAIIPIGVYQRPNSDELFFHQFTEFYERRDVGTDEMVRFLSQLESVAPLDMGWIDTAGGETVLNTLRTYGFNLFPAIKDRTEIVTTVRPLIESQRFTLHKSCVNSINEFYGYRWKQARDGITGERFDTDVAGANHADGHDGRRYAVVGFIQALRRRMGATQPRSMRVEVRR